jgi:nicotinamide mononucleotide adenylyltransferase
MPTGIYLAHLNPLTNAHVEIINDLLEKKDKVVVMPVRFLKQDQEINSKSFPFNFDIRKKMLEAVFGDNITISTNYTFFAPFKKYFPPLIAPKSWELRKQILNGIDDDYYTYTGDKAEGVMLKLYRLKPKVGTRRKISATSVKNDMYESVITKKSKWKENVPEQIADIIKENWNVVTKFASSEDKTMRIVGMKFPKEGYNSK